jgi:hypothetical protein
MNRRASTASCDVLMNSLAPLREEGKGEGRNPSGKK